MARRVRLDAPAKINLRLRVLAREETGYHSLETLFCALSFGDCVIVEAADSGITLEVHGDVETGPPHKNLVMRAAERFYDECNTTPAAAITLHKRIPSAAGLGGGSSDAAATLRALNALYDQPLTSETLLRLGGELGSDVPFFLCGSPFALAWSRGERLLTLPPPPPRPVLVVHPGAAMPTAEAFRRLAALRTLNAPPPPEVLNAYLLGAWESIAAHAQNDFERVAFAAVPALGEVKRALNDARASIALLAGSGACMFGVFPDAAFRDAAQVHLRRAGYTTFPAETLGAVPVPRPG